MQEALRINVNPFLASAAILKPHGNTRGININIDQKCVKFEIKQL